jgi:hypothetical protein
MPDNWNQTIDRRMMKSRAEWCNFLWKILVIGDFITHKLKYNRSCRIEYHDKAKAYSKKKAEKVYTNISLWNKKITSWKSNSSSSAMFCACKTSLTTI